MFKQHSNLIIGLCLAAVLCSGCASKWSLVVETPDKPPRWSDDSNAIVTTHLGNISGFKEIGTTLPHVLKHIVFGSTDENNRVVRPVAAAVGNGGRIAIADTGCSCVHLYIPQEEKYVQLHAAGRDDLRSPVSVAFDADSRLYVSDSVQAAIHVFDQAGKYLLSIKQAGADALLRPTGLSYALAAKVLFAVDTLKNRIYAFDHEGVLLFSFGGTGEKQGQFNFPTHIVAAPDGRLYVTDALNFRVQIFDASGNFLASFGHHGNGSGDFAMPKGIAVDKAGVIYVVDSLFDNIQLFNTRGNLLFTIGRRGNDQGEFWLPSGASLDDQDRLYVCDTFNHRVQFFQITGKRHE
jgi:DNA-binding beta-propeller fold protein YncE